MDVVDLDVHLDDLQGVERRQTGNTQREPGPTLIVFRGLVTGA